MGRSWHSQCSKRSGLLFPGVHPILEEGWRLGFGERHPLPKKEEKKKSCLCHSAGQWRLHCVTLACPAALGCEKELLITSCGLDQSWVWFLVQDCGSHSSRGSLKELCRCDSVATLWTHGKFMIFTVCYSVPFCSPKNGWLPKASRWALHSRSASGVTLFHVTLQLTLCPRFQNPLSNPRSPSDSQIPWLSSDSVFETSWQAGSHRDLLCSCSASAHWEKKAIQRE